MCRTLKADSQVKCHEDPCFTEDIMQWSKIIHLKVGQHLHLPGPRLGNVILLASTSHFFPTYLHQHLLPAHSNSLSINQSLPLVPFLHGSTQVISFKPMESSHDMTWNLKEVLLSLELTQKPLEACEDPGCPSFPGPITTVLFPLLNLPAFPTLPLLLFSLECSFLPLRRMDSFWPFRSQVTLCHGSLWWGHQFT